MVFLLLRCSLLFLARGDLHSCRSLSPSMDDIFLHTGVSNLNGVLFFFTTGFFWPLWRVSSPSSQQSFLYSLWRVYFLCLLFLSKGIFNLHLRVSLCSNSPLFLRGFSLHISLLSFKGSRSTLFQ
jgi:hypothetical protein